MASITGLQKELVRRLKENSFSREMLTTRGQLDTYRASFYKTTKRIYTKKQENTGKRLHLHIIIDASGSMGGGDDLAAFISARTMRDTFREVADVHVTYYADIVQHASDELIDLVAQRKWDQDADVFEQEFICEYIRRPIPILQVRYEQFGKIYQYVLLEDKSYYSAIHEFRMKCDEIRQQVTKAGARVVSASIDHMRNVENDELFALDQVFTRCKLSPEDRHVVFLMTDGGCMVGTSLYTERHYHPDLPCGTYVGNMRKPNSTEPLDKFVRRNTKGRDITFIPVGIGKSATNEVRDIFGYGVGYDTDQSTEGQVKEFLTNVLSYCKKLTIFRS